MTNNTIAVIITCHNRAGKTLRCFDALSKQVLPSNLLLDIILVDDGSTDNTSQMVELKFPHAHLIAGDGSLYWNRGMHLGFSVAYKKKYDFYLWLNDDVYLYPNAIATIYKTHLSLQQNNYLNCIVVGSVQDPHSHELVYGGYKKKDFRPLNFKRLNPSTQPHQGVSMDGTCVLIPNAVVDNIGLNDHTYWHYWGDTDYGLRAIAAGFTIWIAPGFVGTCEKNPIVGTFRDPSLSIQERISKLRSIKGLYPPDWLRFIKRHAGVFWPYYAVSPYLRIFFTSFVQIFRGS